MAATAGREQRQTSERGRRRRDLIIEAAGDMLMAEGFSSLSHRSVARRAGVALSATTYYFSSLDSLLETAVRHVAEQWMAAARAKVEALPESTEGQDLARALIDVAALSPGLAADTVDGDAVVSLYDRYVEAARRPHLQAIVADYDAQIEALILTVLRRRTTATKPEHARLVLAVIDGTLLRCYAEGLTPASAVAPVLSVMRLLESASEP